MPINYKDYAKNWLTEIRPSVLERAEHKCENCGLANYSVGYRDSNGKFYQWSHIEDELERKGYDFFDFELKNNRLKNGLIKKAIKIVLTIAHLDHDIENNDYSNLKALCQKCHLDYDKTDNWNRRKFGKKLQRIQLNLF
jgi:hypothetical protein